MKNWSAGFTLLEMLVVIAIIGSLTGLIATNFVGSQAKARDARRKSDLTQIQKALEFFYNDHGRYPNESSGRIAGCGGGSTSACAWGDPLQDGNGTVYLDTIPEEQQSGKQYWYEVSADGLKYQLYARLENDNDPVLDQDGDGDADEYNRGDCGSQNCNYAATSSNTNGNEAI